MVVPEGSTYSCPVFGAARLGGRLVGKPEARSVGKLEAVVCAVDIVGTGAVELPLPTAEAAALVTPWKAARAATPSFSAFFFQLSAARWRISGLAR